MKKVEKKLCRIELTSYNWFIFAPKFGAVTVSLKVVNI